MAGTHARRRVHAAALTRTPAEANLAAPKRDKAGPTAPGIGGNGMTITQRDRDLGTAYAMRPASTRTELTAVTRGTSMGELLRRYWHPVGLASDAGDVPSKVRVLGDDLILFRDRLSRPG